MACLLHLLLVLLTLSSVATAHDWPQFLGPHRNGVSAERDLIDQFPVSGPKVDWEKPLGVGMSGIAVADGKACTMFQDGSRQYVTLIDVSTGETLWVSDIAPNYENSMGDGPRSTPTIDGDSIYALSGEGILLCLALENGETRWSVDSPKQFGGRVAEYGMACSPVLTEPYAIFTVGMPDATVVALDRESGKVAWAAGSDNPPGYSSPALLPIAGQSQLVVFHGNGVFGLEPTQGSTIWGYPFKTDYDCNIVTPIRVGDTVLISAGENHGTVLLDVPTTSGQEVTEVWESLGPKSVLRNEWQTSVLIDGYLYGFDNVGSAGPVTNLNCVEAKTGQLIWRERRFGKGNLIAADGKLWCSTIDGELVIVRATPKGFEELGRASLLKSTRTAPSLSDGKLYLRDNAEILCVDIRK